MLTAPKAERPAAQLPKLTRDPRVLAALKNIDAAGKAITEEQTRITEIPAPTFNEAARGSYLAKLLSAAGLKVTTDDVGNVIGERPGRSSNDIVLLVAHLDTVFPDTTVHVRRDGDRLYAPGITDNGAGLVALVALARAMRDAQLQTVQTILFVADVGEEGEGNLRGMRKLAETYRGRLRYVIALDGASTDYVITTALASRRVEVTISGPGGHSWSDFGAPNPIHAAARAIAQFVNTPLPENPRSSFNVGEIQGGTSVNSIPASASLKVDLRSESETGTRQAGDPRFARPFNRACPTRWPLREAEAWAASPWTSSSRSWAFALAERCPPTRHYVRPSRRRMITSATSRAPNFLRPMPMFHSRWEFPRSPSELAACLREHIRPASGITHWVASWASSVPCSRSWVSRAFNQNRSASFVVHSREGAESTRATRGAPVPTLLHSHFLTAR